MCGLRRAKEEERALGKSPFWWAETGDGESDGKAMNACLVRTPRSGTLSLQGQHGQSHQGASLRGLMRGVRTAVGRGGLSWWAEE